MPLIAPQQSLNGFTVLLLSASSLDLAYKISDVVIGRAQQAHDTQKWLKSVEDVRGGS
jgi:hypothetical protein